MQFPVRKMALMQTNNKKSAWISGEVCEQNGIYFSEVCGHRIVKEFRSLDIFTRCSVCQQAVRWMRWTMANNQNFDPTVPPSGKKTA